MRPALALLVLAGCTDNTVTVTPIIDIPLNDTAQVVDLDTLTLSVAHAGADVDITSATFQHGDPIELPGVPFGDDLVVHMVGRVGSAEVAYGRTCQFTTRPDARIPSPHLFFSREVKFGELSQHSLPRLAGDAMMYRDGSGLIVGGYLPDEMNLPKAVAQVERYDPNTALYDVLHDVSRRTDAAAALVGTGPDTRMVIVGGLDEATAAGAQYVEVVEAERTTDRQYENFTDYSLQRVGLSATTLSDGRVVVIGGKQAPGSSSEISRAYTITVTTGTTALIPVGSLLNQVRYEHSATRLSDEIGAPVLVAGGLDPTTDKPVAQAELFKPLADAFTTSTSLQMLTPRWNHRAVRLPDGSVLFIGGLGIVDQMSGKIGTISEMERFSPLDGKFVDAGPLPATAGRIGMTATVLPDGRVLLTGGRNEIGGPPLNNAFIARLDPVNGNVDVVATDRLGVPRADHQATLLCDGTVLISGGTTTSESLERYNPPSAGRR
jgi:hypothetical protein